MAANLWARRPDAHAREILAEVHTQALAGGYFVSELRAPSIALEAHWRSD
jgi:hypothetical protein